MGCRYQLYSHLRRLALSGRDQGSIYPEDRWLVDGQDNDQKAGHDALQTALTRQKPETGLILHSDRGVQYACTEYQNLLKKHGIVCSMSRSENPYDNAPMESFFSTLKTEWTHHYDYKTRSEAKSSIFEYIERFYNPRRLNSSISARTPCEFEYDHQVAIHRVYFSG
jgi:putative transposase